MYEDENKNAKVYIKRFASLVLILILLAMAGCSFFKGIGEDTGGTHKTDVIDGYIMNDTSKILVVLKVDTTTGQRIMSKRIFGLDGTHFTAEEEYIAERPSMLNDLLTGNPITFAL